MVEMTSVNDAVDDGTGCSAVMGQIVVVTGMIEVVRCVERAGQCFTVAGHWVMVSILVE